MTIRDTVAQEYYWTEFYSFEKKRATSWTSLCSLIFHCHNGSYMNTQVQKRSNALVVCLDFLR